MKKIVSMILSMILALTLLGGTVALAATGDKESPVKFGKTYTWKASKTICKDKMTATYSLKVKKVKTLTTKQATSLGCTKLTNSSLEYKLITVKWVVKNATLKKVKGNGYIFQNMTALDLAGSVSNEGDTVIGWRDSHFDGSLDDALDTAIGLNKLEAGKKCSYSIEGKVIVPAFKGKTNYLVIHKKDEDYSKIYFQLKK